MDIYYPLANCTSYLCSNKSMKNMVSFNESYYEYVDVSFWQAPQLIILVVLFVFIVLGNLSVLLALGLAQTGRKSRMNVFIVNLAIADLSVGVFHLSTEIAEKCLVAWYGGSVFCKIIRFFQVLVIYASTFMIVALSIDRVDAIARPMNFTRHAITVRILVNTAWILSALMSIPSLLLFDTVEHTRGSLCVMTLTEHWQWKVYVTLVAMSAFIIPALIIIICYSIIIFVIWEKGRGFHNTYHAQYCGNHARSQDGGNKGIIPQAKIKTIKMTLLIVLVFVFSWSPYFVFNLMDVYNLNVEKSPTEYAVSTLIQSLAPLNSAANPIIYGLYGTRIFQNLRNIPRVSFITDMLCKCLHTRRHSQLRNPSEQTNFDAITSRNSSKRSLRNGMRNVQNPYLLTKRKWSSCEGRVCTKPVNLMRTKSDLSKGTQITTNHGRIAEIHFKRRPSGMPFVNKRMTSQDEILLESLRICRNAEVRNDETMTKEESLSSDNEKVKVI